MTSSEHVQDRTATRRLLRRIGMAGHPEPADAQVPLAREICRTAEGRRITSALFVVVGAFALPFGLMLGTGAGLAAVGLAGIAVGAVIAVLPTQEMHERWFQALPVVIGALLAAGVAAAAPYGGTIVPLLTFLGPTIAFVIISPRARIPHAVFASTLILLPVLTWSGTAATIAGSIIALAVAWGLGLFVALVWDGATRQTRRLEELVRADPLTGVGNRRLLDERLRSELARHELSRRRLALVVLDLNGFKEINDTLGHHAGDEVLRRVAAVLQDTAREQDTVARAGGDEFCVLLPQTGRDAAHAFVAELQDALARVDENGRSMSAAIGIAVFPDDAADAAGLFDAADARQRADKAGLRPRRTFPFTGEHADVSRRALRLPGLRALADDLEGAFASARPGPGGRGETVVRRVTRLRSVRAAVGVVFAGTAALCTVGGLWWFDGRSAEMFALAAMTLVTAGLVQLVPTHRMDARWFHALPVLVTVELAAGIVLMGPDAYAAFPIAAFLGCAIAFAIQTPRAMAAHVVLAVATLGAAVLSVGTRPVLAGAICMFAVLVWCVLYVELTWRSTDAQSEHLAELMRRDPLTGVGNRRLLTERVDDELRRHQRTGRPLTVFALDLNGFKHVNDTLGHAVGDDLLRATAAALGRAVRPQDTVVRQGGDEFFIVAPETGPNQARALARSVRAALAQVTADGRPLTAGIGSATFPDDGVTAADLAHTADIRQLADKPRGATRGAPAAAAQVTGPRLSG